MTERERHANKEYSGERLSMEQGGGFESLMTNESPYEMNSNNVLTINHLSKM